MCLLQDDLIWHWTIVYKRALIRDLLEKLPDTVDLNVVLRWREAKVEKTLINRYMVKPPSPKKWEPSGAQSN